MPHKTLYIALSQDKLQGVFPPMPDYNQCMHKWFIVKKVTEVPSIAAVFPTRLVF